MDVPGHLLCNDRLFFQLLDHADDIAGVCLVVRGLTDGLCAFGGFFRFPDQFLLDRC